MIATDYVGIMYHISIVCIDEKFNIYAQRRKEHLMQEKYCQKKQENQ